MKLILVSGWATKSTVWKSVMRVLTAKVNVEFVQWWDAMNGELERIVAGSTEGCIVAGWSMGGQIALRAAACNPENLAGLFLVSSMTCLIQRGRRPGVSRKTPRQIKVMLERNRRVYLRAFYAQCLDPMKGARIIGNLLGDSDSITMGTLLSGLEYMVDTEAGLSIEAPLMAVHGRDDKVIPWECSEYISRNTADNSRVVYVEKAGHLLPIIQPETVGNLLNEFIEYCITR